jgi:hypothetical protein
LIPEVMGSPATHLVQHPAAAPHTPCNSHAQLLQAGPRIVTTLSTGINTASDNVLRISTPFIDVDAQVAAEELGCGISTGGDEQLSPSLLASTPGIVRATESLDTPRMAGSAPLPLRDLDVCWTMEKLAVNSGQTWHNMLSDKVCISITSPTTASNDKAAAVAAAGSTSPQRKLGGGSSGGGGLEVGITGIPLQLPTPLETCARPSPSATTPWWRRLLPFACCFGGSAVDDGHY